MRQAVVHLEQVGYCYADGSRGLAACDLSITGGTRNVLLGLNGSGKTTLLQHINALLRAQQGRILIDGRPLDTSRAGLNELRRRVGLVFQNPDRQLFSANVREDVSFGPLNLGLDDTEVRQRVESALRTVGLLDLADRPVHHLSFGQKKRVCIAGVLAMRPEILLLDEPMAGLDAAMQTDLVALLDDLASQGLTIVLTTHDVDFAYRWADHIHLLKAGRCIASLPAAELPAHVAQLAEAGQPLPQVIPLHARLSALGLLPREPQPRSLDQLLACLPGHPSDDRSAA